MRLKYLRNSLKIRLIFAFSLFALLLSLFYWVLLVGFLVLSEDNIFNRQLANELTRQQQFHLDTGRFDKSPRDMTIYVGNEIESFVYFDDIKDIPFGFSELEEKDFHIAKAIIAPTNQEFHLVYSVADQMLDESSFIRYNQMFFLIFVIVATTGVALGVFVGGRSAAPILKLDKQVRRLEQDSGSNIAESFGDDEVGRLAKSFAQSYERSQKFLAREKCFTREVSHELRTPIAVISGALDILDIQPDNPKALGRIRRATTQIQRLIETFLLLGREENMRFSELDFDAQALCQNIIEQQSRDSQVPIHFTLSEDPKLHVLAPVFGVVLNNLLANAVRHTADGKVDVILNKNSLTVKDSGSGFDPIILSNIGKPYLQGSQGQGLGLSIVGRICQQFNWRFEVDSQAGEGSCISIHFNP